MKALGLLMLVVSANAFSVEQPYSQALLDQAQGALCNAEDTSRMKKLAKDMHELVVSKLEIEAKAANIPFEDYINKKETHDAFQASLQEMKPKDNLSTKDQHEFILLGLEVGLRFQILSTVRFPTLSMIDKVSEVLQGEWLPLMEDIINNPQGCSSNAQVNSSERSSDPDKGSSSEAEGPSSPGAVQR